MAWLTCQLGRCQYNGANKAGTASARAQACGAYSLFESIAHHYMQPLLPVGNKYKWNSDMIKQQGTQKRTS